MANYYYWQEQNLMLHVHLQPAAKKDEVIGLYGSALKIKITAPPVDGKANEHLIQFLASLFDLPLSHVTIIRGMHHRQKWIKIVSPRRLIPGIERE